MLITGANRGIGARLAQDYAAKGDRVTGTARDGSATHSLDVTDPASHKTLASSLQGQPIDLLICNAGVYLEKGDQLETGYAPELWSESFAANVTGVFLTIQTLLPNLRHSDTPKIALMSSQMASHTRAPGGSYIYRASKAAVLNLGRNLATDLKSDGIAVGMYHPGWVRTDMGGGRADISVEDASAGLIARFDDLSLASTGCFLTWDGREHPY